MGNTYSGKKDDWESTFEPHLKTEVEVSSIQVAELIVPVHGQVSDVSFGMDFSVEEQVERFIRKFSLDFSIAECELVIIERDGTKTRMAPNDLVEQYIDLLTSSSSIVQLVHTRTSEDAPNHRLGSLGVDLKAD